MARDAKRDLRDCLVPKIPPTWRAELAKDLATIDASVPIAEIAARLERPGAVLFAQVVPGRAAALAAVFRKHDVEPLFVERDAPLQVITRYVPLALAGAIFIGGVLSVTVWREPRINETESDLLSSAPPPPPVAEEVNAVKWTATPWTPTEVQADFLELASGALVDHRGTRKFATMWNADRNIAGTRCVVSATQGTADTFRERDAYVRCTSRMPCKDAVRWGEAALAASAATADSPLAHLLIHARDGVGVRATRAEPRLTAFGSWSGREATSSEMACNVELQLSRAHLALERTLRWDDGP